MSTQQPYFVDHRRGEVNELRGLLRNEKVIREPLRKREVIKKVIAYMTLGIDVSRLFNEMIMAGHTKDLVQKKMVYHYLCSYAEQKADLAIMAINTLHKDVKDDDPMVRGLALRSLCSLRLPNIVEYSLQPLRQRLNDPSAYVRKTAVLGVVKLFTRHPHIVKSKDSDLVDVLYNMLRDKDAQVVTNVINALNEILADEGEMAINASIVSHLLNRLHEFNEWGQCAVLTLVGRYVPAAEAEMYDIMNLLEERLRHANGAVVLAAVNVFLRLTQHNAQLHNQVFQRIKAPLLTLMGSGSFELTYAVLGHVKLLVERNPGVFDDEFKHFFCRYNDPACVKSLKLDILQNLATRKNYGELLTEFAEYVTDVDADIARKSIAAIANVAIKIDSACDEAIESLLGFLDLNTDYITAETCIVTKNLLRKYPERYEEVIPALQKTLKTIDEEDGKVAVIWMIGEYGETIKDAPYILEPLIDGFAEETSRAVRMELLTAAMKLFFKRPPELQKMLGRLLQKATQETSHTDVRDRALLYYRLLSYDVHEAARVVNNPGKVVDTFVEAVDKDLQDRLFAEFNSLSVVYNKPAKNFVTGVDMSEEVKREEEERKRKEAEAAQEQGVSASLVGARDPREADDQGDLLAETGGAKFQKASVAIAKEVDLLGMDMLGGDVGSAPAPAARAGIQLKAQPFIDAPTFQAQWVALPVAHSFVLPLRNARAEAPQFERLAAQLHINTIASGSPQEHIMKFYFYAQAGPLDTLYLIEAVADFNSNKLSSTVKTDAGAESAQQVAAIMTQALGY